MLKTHSPGAFAPGKDANPAVSAQAFSALAFTGAFAPDHDDNDPQPPTPPSFYTPLLLDDGGGLDLDASMLGSGAMSFVLTDAPELTMSAGAAAAAPRTSANSAIALQASLARSRFAVSGSGVRVGILSNSFNLLGGYARDVADGDLPGGIRILEEGAAGGSDEGRAMAELVHQVAPGANIMFHTATGSEADFAAGILALQQDGCQIIVDDVSYLDEPFFQDGGVLQKAVEQVVADGTSYFTSASNEGQNFFQAAWSPVTTRLPGLPGTFRTENFGTAQAPSSFITLNVPINGTSYGDCSVKQPFLISWRDWIRGSSPFSSCGSSRRTTSYPVGPRTVRTTIPHT